MLLRHRQTMLILGNLAGVHIINFYPYNTHSLELLLREVKRKEIADMV